MNIQYAVNQLLKRLDSLHAGTLTLVTPDGVSRTFGGRAPGEEVRLELTDWRVITNFLRRGNIGLAEDYREGRWETDDLTGLTMLALENRKAMQQMIIGKPVRRILASLGYMLRLNTLKGSRKNIHAHYDLGNQFYREWLDPSMTYSAAIFRHEGESLQAAQYNKYDRILDCLGADSGKMMEIGCGWGGLADRATSRADFDIKAITLSEEQYDYARKRLGDRAEVKLEDYRNQSGRFDSIVSIEMFEAVGERFWKTYFEKLASLLNSKGKAVIQTITMNEGDFSSYRKGADFIRTFIFPGGMLPSPSRFKEEANKAGLVCSNEYFFGQDYATTLEHWLKSFDEKREVIQQM
nr:cyclopropane-fatty-acyl-phospholipid synthase family protein [Cellvibrionaceae bacterium]